MSNKVDEFGRIYGDVKVQDVKIYEEDGEKYMAIIGFFPEYEDKKYKAQIYIPKVKLSNVFFNGNKVTLDIAECDKGYESRVMYIPE